RQLKVRGFRVEPGEVRAALQEHPGVRVAEVVARRDAVGERLVAYVVPAALPAPGGGELRAFLAERLPEYMLPSAVVMLDALPLTSTGKLDRGRLPPPELADLEPEAEYVAPRTPAEAALAAIWAELLGLERVGVHDDFFALGGYSLLATRLLSRVRASLGVELAMRPFFEGPTVAELAALVEAGLAGGAGSALPPIRRQAPPEAPLSFAQQRLWFIHQLDGGGAAYHVPAALRLEGRLDVAALGRGVEELVSRHEALRTVFAVRDGAPVQVVAPAACPLPVEDLTHLPGAEREAEARRIAAAEAARPFDLERGPLFRAKLLRLGAGEHVLVLCMHHLVADGWSLDVLFRELAALYGAFTRGEPSPLPPLPVRYADYALWQREHLDGEVLERQLAYWRERLAGAPGVLELPTDRPRPAEQSFRGARERFRLAPGTTAAVRALGAREGATPYMVLLAAFQLLLARYSGEDDLVVGSPIAGRTRPETEGLVGFFANTLALRGDLSGRPTFRELLGRVRETALGAYQHQEVPFEKLVEAAVAEPELDARE
ncbi:MAG TPA: condensation domain-containing protein, partial [Longimicrobiaceae bacterium]|nr:condensation domain-containing protein [Longimicrobiaceae bacterium]